MIISSKLQRCVILKNAFINTVDHVKTVPVTGWPFFPLPFQLHKGSSTQVRAEIQEKKKKELMQNSTRIFFFKLHLN